MTDLELRKKGDALQAQFEDVNISDEEIISQIKEFPELINIKLMTGMNLFMAAIHKNRFPVAKTLSDMGADIHWTCSASKGNALNVANSPQQADDLLALGLEIEKNLLLSKPFRNPAIMAAERNNKTMLLYWLDKQMKIFADEEEYVKKLLYAAMDMVSMMNQYGMLSCVIADEELFNILKDIYSNIDSVNSIRLYISALNRIDDENLKPQIKELKKVLNTRKKEISSAK